MRPSFVARILGFKPFASVLLVGLLTAGHGTSALADVSSWVSTSAPELIPDPGAAGAQPTTALGYEAASYVLPNNGGTVAMRGWLVAPASALVAQESVKRPLVVFLHGHYFPADCGQTCPELRTYKGYQHIQQRLASKGYMSISIDQFDLTNGGNNQEPPSRMVELIGKHLALVSGWAQSGVNEKFKNAAKNVDLTKVVLVGHSVGGQGVGMAAAGNKSQQLNGPMPFWRVAGQILIAPSSTAPADGINTFSLISGCDSLASIKVASQNVVDDVVHHNYLTSTSSVLIRGANHDWANSEWVDDDIDVAYVKNQECYRDTAGDPNDLKNARLSMASQLAVTNAYITAAVSAFVGGDTNAWKAIDGTPSRMASANVPRAEVRVSGKGRMRTDVMAFDPLLLTHTVSGGVGAGFCSAGQADMDFCMAAGVGGGKYAFLNGQPYASLPGQQPARSIVWVSWSSPNGSVFFKHNSGYESGYFGQFLGKKLGLRIAQLSDKPGAIHPITVNLKLHDIKHNVLNLGNVTVTPLQSLYASGTLSKGLIWAQEIRVPVSRTANPSFDSSSVEKLEITPISPATGKFWLVDAFSFYQ